MRGHLGDQLRAQPVGPHAGVAVDVILAATADDERRIGHNQVEPLAGDRRKETAAPQIPRLPTGSCGRGGQGQRSLVGVSGDHLRTMGTQVQRLHPAAGPEVQCPLHRPPDDGPRQRDRRGADAQDVIGGECPRPPPGVLIGEDHVLPRIVGVRPHIKDR